VISGYRMKGGRYVGMPVGIAISEKQLNSTFVQNLLVCFLYKMYEGVEKIGMMVRQT